MEARNLVKVRFLSDREEYVDDTTLNELISSKKIRELYRPSEGRWVGKTLLAIRRERSLYPGMERRALNRRIFALKDRTLDDYRRSKSEAPPARRRIDIYC